MSEKSGKLQSDLYFFRSGNSSDAYGFMGCHRDGAEYVFRVWAPDADAVSLVGSFDSWGGGFPMERLSFGIWELILPDSLISEGDLYKFRIENGGRICFRADPYGVKCECPPGSASEVYTDNSYVWHDEGWLKKRKNQYKSLERPLNIYEIHAGSWKRHADGRYYSFHELADELAPYVKQMGYTHVELMPVAEYPYDGSWGYQTTGYFAPTGRFGSPSDFMGFVDSLHSAGVGVILDWVPTHFPKDEAGLCEFDGAPLYEYSDKSRQENPVWGTRYFDVGRGEVQSFLISNAVFWLEKYHIDGIRVDAVSAMLHLDYDRRAGEWMPNDDGGNINTDAVGFLKKLNSTVLRKFPDVMMIAEEASSDVKITGSDGLGFTYKWNMGWMNDTLSYASADFDYRKQIRDKLTFSLTYAFSENFVLPVSHDEVVHGKRSYLDRMPGDYWRKFAGARAFYCWQMTHPGKKLTFMGSEIGQFREWDYDSQVEWFLLDFEMHAKYQLFSAEINRFYLSTPALWERDCSWDGFDWIDADESGRGVLSYIRRDKAGNELAVIVNFMPDACEDFEIRLPRGEYIEVFNSDSREYGGSGVTNGDYIFISDSGRIRFRLPPLGCCILRKL